MAFSTEKLLPAVWTFMKIPAATVVPNDGYPIVIRQRQTKQVRLIVPAAAAQTSSLRSVSFVGHGSCYSGCDSCSVAACAAAAAAAAAA